MKGLTSFSILPCINTSEHQLSEDFFIPCLTNSIRYDRGVGYFSSGWLKINAKGLEKFAENGGTARWITSPILSKEDWEALLKGDRARKDEILKLVLSKNIRELERSLEKDTLNTLAWLVADDILTFKLAIPRNNLDGEFHDKFGVFYDSYGNQIGFTGSMNESIRGIRNYESISIFKSWDAGQLPYLESQISRFERLWNNKDLNLEVYSIDDSNRKKIIQLRQSDRPYIPKNIKYRSPSDNEKISEPHIPDYIKLRSYQEEAIQAWFDKNCRGIFNMATRTGKTITALSAIVRLYNETKRLIVVISCPFIHLANQWVEEAKNFGLMPILVGESRLKWEATLNRQAQLFKRNRNNLITIITTNNSFVSDIFQTILKGAFEKTLIVFDEVHYAGASKIRRFLPYESPFRLGLSATPTRHRDEEGSEAIIEYFGEEVFSLPMQKVIGKYLTNYWYYPFPVEMTEEEFERYCELSAKISKLYATQKEDLIERADKHAIERARILNNSVSKLIWLRENLTDKPIDYSLFYAGERIFNDVKMILSNDFKVRLHEFTSRQSPQERASILRDFSSNEIQSLVAMKCLDEGVDVPPTRIAYFLASSSNPREFIQRRGRVLRVFRGT